MIDYPKLKPQSKKIAFFGGSFNPLHCGHLELLAVLQKKKLVDEVIVVPNCSNPLENKKQYLSKEVRWYILRKAFQGENFFHLWNYELFQKKAFFTAESIRLLQNLKFSVKKAFFWKSS